MAVKVTIIILTWNGLEYTRTCLDSLCAHTPLGDDVRVLVVDNGSTDATLPYLRSLDWIRLIENGKNLGFVRGNNVGIHATPPDHDVLLLNNDIVIPQGGWLGEIQRVAYSADDIGVVGCRLVLPDGRLLHAGAYMPLGSFWGQQIGSLEKDVNQYNADRDVESVVGACMYLKRRVLEAIGPLEEAFFSYFEDTDYCLRAAEAGFRTVCAGGVTLIHHQNVTTHINRVSFSKMFLKSQKIFRKRWKRKMVRRYKTRVLWHSEVGSASGYATSSREMILQLDALGVDVRLAYVYGTDWMDTQRDDHRIAAMRQRPKDLSLPQVLYAPGELFVKNSGRYRIGYTMLEVDGLPEDWARLCNEMDEVWVPSPFNLETFRKGGVTRPIYVIPQGVNPDHYNPYIKAFRATSRYTFLSVFEWGERKAPETMLRAYHHAFSRKDNVLLVLKVFNRDLSVDVRAQIAALDLPKDGPPVALLYNYELPTESMGSLYRSVDCFVLPTRGEGWGLPILEAMACGLPAIATNWSAPTCFMTEENAYPVNYRMIPAMAKCPYYKGFRWAEPDMEHMAERMRYVYEHQDEARQKGERASQEVLEHWTWRHTALQIQERLLQIEHKMRSDR